MTSDDQLQQGIAAAKQGQNARARELLQAFLSQNPASEPGWLWLSGLLDEPAARRDCLQRVLAINPSNELARGGLAQLAQSEAASFLAAFEPHNRPETIAPPAGSLAKPVALALANELLVGIAEGASSQPAPAAAPAAGPPMPAVSQVAAPCIICGTLAGGAGICPQCGTEQVLDCPQCARAVDLRESRLCSCGADMKPFILANGLDRERLGNEYQKRDYPAAAVKQWKAALATSAKPAVLHRRIAEVYLKLGMIEQARTHNELARQGR